jgi:hypothetical protein
MHFATTPFSIFSLLAAFALINFSGPTVVSPDDVKSTPPSFATIKRLIFRESCSTSSCHGTMGQVAGLDLDREKGYNRLVNQPAQNKAARAKGMLLVVPGKPEASFLYLKCLSVPEGSGRVMPAGSKGLDFARLSLLRDWIKGGAKDGPDDGRQLGRQPELPEDVTLPPPPPGQGIQFTLGPFEVPGGDELQRDYYFKLPIAEEMAINRVEMASNQGNHHFFLMKSDREDVPDHYQDGFGSGSLWIRGYNLVAATQRTTTTLTFPAGVVTRLRPRQQMCAQVHAVSLDRSKAGRCKVVVNLWTAKPGTFTMNSGMMLFYRNSFILPPHQETLVSNTATVPMDTKIWSIAGHYHGRGKKFAIYLWDGAKPVDRTKLKLLYETEDWTDPHLKVFDPPLVLKKGQGFYYEGTFVNNTDREIHQGPNAKFEEHCIMVAGFFPGFPGGGGAWSPF